MTILDWRDPKHFDDSGDKPCVCCGKPTPMRSDLGKPVHKVCAENWIDTHRPDEKKGGSRR